jgi:hypothetical protein
MARWEYKVVVHKLLMNVPDTAFSADIERANLLNSYGSQGWELVGIMNQSYRRESDPTALYGYTIASYFLKRAIGSSPPADSLRFGRAEDGTPP